MERIKRVGVWLDPETLIVIDAEIRRRRMRDGGRHSRTTVIRDAVSRLVQQSLAEEREREVRT